ncbi:MAG: DUF418 domain-containing protein [Candidatus Zixiibacteriota bacterium]
MQESAAIISASAPVREAERYASIDVLRGIAVLGILAINIYFFALPGNDYIYPSASGGFAGLNLLTWKFTSLFFLQKMMGIFSMLFGAGIVMMYDKAERAGRKFKALHYRRMFWLLIIGMIHAYFIWHGDILVTYAICGMILFIFRRRSPRTLIILGLALFFFGILIQVAGGYNFSRLKESAAEAERILQEGGEISKSQEESMDAWKKVSSNFNTTEDSMKVESDAFRGGYVDVFKFRLPYAFMMQTQALIFIVIWRTLGIMLLGMALMKLGIFSAQRSMKFYLIMTLLGYGTGLPLVMYGINELIAHNFDFIYQFKVGMNYNHIGSVLVALGHVGLVMLLYKWGILKWLTRCLAAVGRMALSNYLFHAVVFTTIFYGYGLGLFNRFDRFYLMWFVAGMWVVNLAVSPLWLKYFQFGPAEWLWRTLTYRKRQPMRIIS